MRIVLVRNHIKEYCHKNNVTMKQLCDKTGISTAQMYKGQEINFRLDNIAKILDALDCKFEDIFEIMGYDVK